MQSSLKKIQSKQKRGRLSFTGSKGNPGYFGKNLNHVYGIIIYVFSSTIRNKAEDHRTPLSESSGPLRC